MPAGTPSLLLSTVIAPGGAPRNPNACGSATLSVLPVVSRALNTVPSARRSSSAVLAWNEPFTSSRAFGPNRMPAGLSR